MNYISSISHHLKHPFTMENTHQHLTSLEKKIAYIAGAAGILLGVIGAPILFYCTSACLKHFHKNPTSDEIRKTDNIAKNAPPFVPNEIPVAERVAEVRYQDVELPFEELPFEDVELPFKGVELEGVELEGVELFETFPDEELFEKFPDEEIYGAREKSANSKNRSYLDWLFPPKESDLNTNQVIEIFSDDFISGQDKKNHIRTLLLENFNEPEEIIPFAEAIIKRGISDRDRLLLIQALPADLQPPFFKYFLDGYFDIHDMTGDGNCCVYSFVYARNPLLFNLDDDSEAQRQLEKGLATKLRKKVVSHMRKPENENYYKNFCTHVGGKDTPLEEKWNKYNKYKEQGSRIDITFYDFLQTEIARAGEAGANAINYEYANLQVVKKKGYTHEELENHLRVKYPQRNPDGEREVSFDKYLEIMAEDGTYFGPQEIQAFSELNRIPVYVYDPQNVYLDDHNKLRPMKESCFGLDFAKQRQPIYLYHKAGNHYELLTPKAEVEIIPPPGTP